MANIFPRRANAVPLNLLLCVGGMGVLFAAGLWYYYGPLYTRVGYEPVQPCPYDHALHVGQLGMDCRYCHTYVEISSHANIPTTQTCMNCHAQVKAASPTIDTVRRSWDTGEPVRWVRIHRLPDYVYFDHSAHVNRGVGCASCHGPIHQMRVVRHQQPLSMGWCLDCHRHPERQLRPPDRIYDPAWRPPPGAEGIEQGRTLAQRWAIAPPQDCAGCHR